jgi:hypothetical protein
VLPVISCLIKGTQSGAATAAPLGQLKATEPTTVASLFLEETVTV